MLKKTFILALLLLALGIAGLRWAQFAAEKELQLAKQQEMIAESNLSRLDNIVNIDLNSSELDEFLSDEGIQIAIDEHKTRKEANELVTNIGLVLVATGIFSILITAVVTGIQWIVKMRCREDADNAQASDCKRGQADDIDETEPEEEAAESLFVPTEHLDSDENGDIGCFASQAGENKIDEAEAEYYFAEQQFTEPAHLCQRRPDQDSERIGTTLVNLTKQVEAIREYASSQQERVTRLQDGYDYNIIKNFCIRIIRCIDNLDKRIDLLESENSITVAQLREIRDELLFALESSGIEQFRPRLKSDYRGQEKLVEVIKEKHASENPKLKGKIARIIRCGYRYLIDDKNVKVIRTAQVALFD